jgi:hypothetical protein
MWRMLPAFWVVGLLGIGYGLPLRRGRVRPNPYYGLRLSEDDGDDIWYPVNALLGKDLGFVGLRIVVVTSVLATFHWRQPQHYVYVGGGLVVAELALMDWRWRRIAADLHKQLDEARGGQPDHGLDA